MAKVAAIKISHSTFESKDGSDSTLSPIIFLHGITAAKEVWENIPQVIADRTKRKVFAYDARNHGHTEYTDEFSFDLNVDDLFHFMDSMNIQKAILIGHSMGGLTATNAALRHPDRIEMVISEDMHVNKLSQGMLDACIPIIQLRQASFQNMPKGLSEKEAIQFSTDYIISNIPENSPLLSVLNKEDMYKAKVFVEHKSDGSYDLKLNANAVIKAVQNAETLMSEPSGQYNGPAYFIYGNKSFIKVDAHEENIKEHFPKAKLILFDGATHNVHLDFYDKFIDTILNCLQQ